MVLFAQPEQIKAEVQAVLNAFGPPVAGAGHVFNLGHGINQHTPMESVEALVEAVHTLSRRPGTAPVRA